MTSLFMASVVGFLEQEKVLSKIGLFIDFAWATTAQVWQIRL